MKAISLSILAVLRMMGTFGDATEVHFDVYVGWNSGIVWEGTQDIRQAA